MAFPTKYSGWITYIRDWLGVDEYSDNQIKAFLDLAQLRLNRDMASYGMEASIPFTIVDGNPIPLATAVPDFNKIRLVSPRGLGPFAVAAINEMIGYQQGGEVPAVNAKGFYTIDAGLLYLFPVPDPTVIVDIYYYKEVPALSTSPVVDTNTFTTDHPDALLYAACLEASPYVIDNENMAIWDSKYKECVENANDITQRIKMGSTPLVREIPRTDA